MSTTPIRVGFVGLSATGWASTADAPSILKTPNYQITAVSTSSIESATKSAKVQADAQGGKVEVKAYHGDTSAIWNDPNVDLVGITVKARAHKEAIRPVLQAKKNFFVEWPVGASIEETKEILDMAKTAGVKGVVGLQGKFNPIFLKVKELIAAGKIGKVVSTTLVHTVPAEYRAYAAIVSQSGEKAMFPENGISMVDILVGHSLSVVQDVLGPFKTISAHGANMYPTYQVVDDNGEAIGEPKVKENGIYDHISFSGRLESGVFATTTWKAGYKSTPGRKQLSWFIDGDAGSIKLESDNFAGGLLNISDPDLYVNGDKVEVQGADGFIADYIGLWNAYAQGAGYPTLEEAYHLKTVLQAIYQSSKDEGRTVSL